MWKTLRLDENRHLRFIVNQLILVAERKSHQRASMQLQYRENRRRGLSRGSSSNGNNLYDLFDQELSTCKGYYFNPLSISML